jgi:hypothetical protein
MYKNIKDFFLEYVASTERSCAVWLDSRWAFYTQKILNQDDNHYYLHLYCFVLKAVAEFARLRKQ